MGKGLGAVPRSPPEFPVVKSVPAKVCENCGESYIDKASTATLLAAVESEGRAGTEINLRHFQPA